MEELFDILNEDGIPTGVTLPRSQVHREGQWHRAVHIWVIDEWERILLQQRALNKDSNPGLWDISAAGHISAGQNSLEAAVRELQEELGLAVASGRLEFFFADKDTYSKDWRFVDHEFHDVYLLRITAAEARNIKPCPVELAEVRWIAPEVLAEELRYEGEYFVRHLNEYPKLLAHFGVEFHSQSE